MGAVTYTKQKYKYFTLTAEYRFYQRNAPWPVISFNQPDTTPEMFYAPEIWGSKITNPTGGDSAIGAVVEYEGNLRVYGRMANAKVNSTAIDDTQFHKVQLTVTPGQVYLAVYNTDGSVAKEVTTELADSYEGGYISLMLNSRSTFFRNVSIKEFTYADMTQKEGEEQVIVDLNERQSANPILVSTTAKRFYELKSISAVSEDGISYKVSLYSTNTYKIEGGKPLRLTVTYQKRKLDYDQEYTLKYYFDWKEELDDFVATRTPHPEEAPFKYVAANDIWKISNDVLMKPNIDVSDTSQGDNVFADFNILMLKDIKFRNFELTLQYKHGKAGGYSGGIIFGLEDPTAYCGNKDGGIFAMVESDGRGTLYGKSLRNADLRLRPGEGIINIPGYPQWDTTQIHTMKLRVLDGKVVMIIDDANTEDPVVGLIPKDYYGYIALAVANNKGWFDNLTIQPLDEWGNKITLAENENQAEFKAEDIETDTWVDNSEWD